MRPLRLAKLTRCSVNRLTVRITNLSVRSPRNQPDERERSHVRQPNLQGSDRSVRCGWRYRIARHLLLDRDGRVTISAVWASFVEATFQAPG